MISVTFIFRNSGAISELFYKDEDKALSDVRAFVKSPINEVCEITDEFGSSFFGTPDDVHVVVGNQIKRVEAHIQNKLAEANAGRTLQNRAQTMQNLANPSLKAANKNN